MKLTREELLQSPEYWFENAQNDLYGQVTAYMEKEGYNQTQLAQKLGVSKGYVSQILKGEFNYTLKTLIDISLAIGSVPKIEYTPLSKVIVDDAKTSYIELTNEPVYSQYSITKSTKDKVADQAGEYASTYKVA
jgi:transcriptional regulator with XRE-family HTH domain